tara:strand:- start:54 stop:311 length:258 start_codon:yes stop_codon:yes gene_type:complete
MKRDLSKPLAPTYGDPVKKKKKPSDVVTQASFHYNLGGVRKGGDGGAHFRKKFGKGTSAEKAYNTVMSSPDLKQKFDTMQARGKK